MKIFTAELFDPLNEILNHELGLLKVHLPSSIKEPHDSVHLLVIYFHNCWNL